MGPTRLALGKPVIAAVEGYAVAGGLELAIWCDLRVAAEDAAFGVFCRRFGVPLIDGGTVRLPRLVGQGRALDLILTGREVGADEALAMGLVNRVVPPGRPWTGRWPGPRNWPHSPRPACATTGCPPWTSGTSRSRTPCATSSGSASTAWPRPTRSPGPPASSAGAGRGGSAVGPDG